MNKTADLKTAKDNGQALLFPDNVRINVGSSTCNIAKGADLIYNAIEYGLKSKNINATLVKVGCKGLCHMEPVVEIQAPGKPKVIYTNVKETDVPKMLESVESGKPVVDLAFARVDNEDHVLTGKISYTTDSGDFNDITPIDQIESLSKQHRLILRNAGNIDPENINEYIASGGYEALEKALSMKPDQIIEEVTKSALRGRGGGGFPAGLKWKSCKDSKSDEKYLICNVSEGEPGIGMHRSFLESDPHSVLEGLIIGGYSMGAQTAYVYIRDNYRIALSRFKKAVADAEEAGLLGENIFGSKFSMTIKVKEGGGRFVCGEETSLIACLEGKIGEPKQRPPFPTVKGLFGKPTCINNVETWANIPLIILKGSSWYKKIGSSKSSGTKVLSLTGNIAHAGMIEVDMGTPIIEIINKIGGGVANGKKLKGIQTGGPSGGVLPAKDAKLTVDYDELTEAGSMLGSGGMVIMDEDTDMAEIAKYFTDFFVEESCGKCTPCREGVCRMSDILEKILKGLGKQADLKTLEEMADPMTKLSACALGKTAPIPILSTMKHFKKDYLKHIN
jgi:NADH:ubiquinone oxidoreductase subunit F (NADH-binding)/(2Fe-2S) ferredoxin